MTWYMISAGVCLAYGACHLALGVNRPLQVSHIVFAVLMAIMCAFQIVVGAFRSATTLDSAVMLGRYGVLLAILIITVLGVFVREYAQANVPRVIAYGFLAANAAWLVYDLIARQGLLFTSGPPEFRGGLSRVPVGAVELAWHAFNVITMMWAVAVGWRMARRHHARQGIMLAVGTVILAVTVSADTVRDSLGREWPYVGGFGVTALASILSFQLAADFRAQENELTRLLAHAMRIRDRLNTPLQVLQLELELNKQQIGQTVFDRMGRTLAKLTQLGRMLHSDGREVRE
jgi:hypothetical protein